MRQTPEYEVRRLRAIRLLDDDRCLGQPRGGCLGDNRCKEAGFDEPSEERGPDVLELLGEELVGDVTSLPLECEVGDVEIFDPHAAVVRARPSDALVCPAASRARTGGELCLQPRWGILPRPFRFYHLSRMAT